MFATLPPGGKERRQQPPKPTALWNPDTIWDSIKDRHENIGFCADLGHWAPDVPLSAVVCSSSAFTHLSASDRWRVIDTLQDATCDGGVHLVESIAGGLPRSWCESGVPANREQTTR